MFVLQVHINVRESTSVNIKMKAMPRIPRVMLIYSFLVVTLIIILAIYVEFSASRYRLQTVHSMGSRVVRDIPLFDTNSLCETVNLAFVVNDVPWAITLIKSVLIKRHSFVHLHIISDPHTQEILSPLLKSWLLPYFNFTFYLLDSLQKDVSWIPGVKPGDKQDLVKLLLPTLLPSTVERLIVVDTNVTFLGDIRELHGYFWNMHDNGNMFASVGRSQKNMDVSTQEKGLKVEDTDVLLFDVKSMREVEWFHLWHTIIYNAVNTPQYSLSLQLILNLITSAYPNSHFTLPCIWNVHYLTRNQCAANFSEYRLIHWDFTNEELLIREKILTHLVQYDGKVLREKPWVCAPPLRNHVNIIKHKDMPLPKRSRREMCRILKRESEQVFRTHRYYYGDVYKPSSEFETTLVTQLSLDRLDKFDLLLAHWDGPISITMYGTDLQAWNLSNFLQNNGIQRRNLVIHIVYRQGKFYPVNHLRNIALNSVTTNYVFLCDGDFLPSYGLFHYLLKANKLLLARSEKRALVIPAFNGMPGFKYPNNKAELLESLKNNTVSYFCVWCAHQTHGPTNYSVWVETLYPYKVEWAFHFEPYVVVRSDVVRYDERFVGYGWNKVSQITEMKAQGYEFVVIPDGFVIHSPHKRSVDREVWKRKNFKFCINTLWKKFMQDLIQRYGVDCLHEDKKPPVIINIPID